MEKIRGSGVEGDPTWISEQACSMASMVAWSCCPLGVPPGKPCMAAAAAAVCVHLGPGDGLELQATTARSPPPARPASPWPRRPQSAPSRSWATSSRTLGLRDEQRQDLGRFLLRSPSSGAGGAEQAARGDEEAVREGRRQHGRRSRRRGTGRSRRRGMGES